MDWLISGHQSVNPSREAISIIKESFALLSNSSATHWLYSTYHLVLRFIFGFLYFCLFFALIALKGTSCCAVNRSYLIIHAQVSFKQKVRERDCEKGKNSQGKLFSLFLYLQTVAVKTFPNSCQLLNNVYI